MPVAHAAAQRGQVEDYVAAPPLPHSGDGGADTSPAASLAASKGLDLQPEKRMKLTLPHMLTHMLARW